VSKSLLVLLCLALSAGALSACSVWPWGENERTPAPASSLERAAERVALAEGGWAAVDQWGAPTKLLPSGKPDTGDALLWAGILCSSGAFGRPGSPSDPVKFIASCEQVEDSQSPDGRMWRHPSRVGRDTVNSFSRDMAMGLLLAVQATGDVDMLQRWVDYVVENDGACPDATDNRCQMTTTIWSLARIVAPSVDLHGKKALAPKQVLAVLYAAAVGGESGYPLHLIAQQLILLKRAGESGAILWEETAKTLYNREPSNALFAHLAGRNDVAVELLLQQLPTDRPAGASQWSFEREGSSEAWLQSMGWEYVWLFSEVTRK